MATTAKEIVQMIGIVDLPWYYSSRGVNFLDLNADRLYSIYLKIRDKIGNNQANAFVTMVQQLKILSVNNFLDCLYTLENNDWNENTIYKTNLTYTSTDLLLSEDIRKLFLRKISTNQGEHYWEEKIYADYNY